MPTSSSATTTDIAPSDANNDDLCITKMVQAIHQNKPAEWRKLLYCIFFPEKKRSNNILYTNLLDKIKVEIKKSGMEQKKKFEEKLTQILNLQDQETRQQAREQELERQQQEEAQSNEGENSAVDDILSIVAGQGMLPPIKFAVSMSNKDLINDMKKTISEEMKIIGEKIEDIKDSLNQLPNKQAKHTNYMFLLNRKHLDIFAPVDPCGPNNETFEVKELTGGEINKPAPSGRMVRGSLTIQSILNSPIEILDRLLYFYGIPCDDDKTKQYPAGSGTTEELRRKKTNALIAHLCGISRNHARDMLNSPTSIQV